MIGRYAVLAGRIRQDVAELEGVVNRAERAVQAGRQPAPDQDLFLDSAALNVHDFYSGLERIFLQIASSVDESVPAGPDWHRELLRQMTIEIPGRRSQVLDPGVAAVVDEFLRFRHVVRHNYAFALEPERIERLASRLPAAHRHVAAALIAFATLLDELARDE